ncbi:hypothetical protein [Nonomuraea sp. NPDC005692]|uniref:hypothetical protein n=1 Tax=Nonomuraea sp. NPDC005692 TaxID=3157168 RepID=UPI0033FB610C
MDAIKHAAALKERLVNFALSPQFTRELDAAFERTRPDDLADSEVTSSMIVDHFALQHRLASGDTVIDRFLRAHPGLSPQERAMLLGWRDVVEGIFEVQGKEQDAVVLFNLVDELTYRARSNMGKSAFRPIERGMFLICRLVPLREGWLVSAHISLFPAEARDQLLTQAADIGLRNPKLVFRNPDKLATARRMLAAQREVFLDLYDAEYIVVTGRIDQRVPQSSLIVPQTPSSAAVSASWCRTGRSLQQSRRAAGPADGLHLRGARVSAR